VLTEGKLQDGQAAWLEVCAWHKQLDFCCDVIIRKLIEVVLV
jgi:hypothetical protein